MKSIVYMAGALLCVTLVACGGSTSTPPKFIGIGGTGNNEVSPFIMSGSSLSFHAGIGTIILDEIAGPRRITLTMPNDKLTVGATFNGATAGFLSRYDNMINGSAWTTTATDTGTVSLTVVPPNMISVDFSQLGHSGLINGATGVLVLGDATDHLVTAPVANAVWGAETVNGLPSGAFSNNAEMSWEINGTTSTVRVLDNANLANETSIVVTYPASASGTTEAVTAPGVSVKYFQGAKEWDASAGTITFVSSTKCGTATSLTLTPVTATGAKGTITPVDFPSIGS